MILFVKRTLSTLYKYRFWLFATGAGIGLVAIEDIEPLFSILLGLYFGALLYLALRSLMQQSRAITELKNEKAQTELLHLKSQVNPHFFFNTLNNLYGLVGKDPEKAQKLILKLSDMMRYSIYEGQKEWVALEDEIAYLENYIALHKMRYHKKIDIVFDREIEQQGIRVMPLLFIILVENAFKHGVETLRENAYVHIQVISNENEICMKVENNFDIEEKAAEQGLGLQNLEKRLALAYPNRHSFSHSNTNDVYKTRLTLVSP